MQFLMAMLISTAFAQDNIQGADPKFMQTAIQVLQAQRNRALDEAAAAQAQLAKAIEDKAELQKQLDALKGKK